MKEDEEEEYEIDTQPMTNASYTPENSVRKSSAKVGTKRKNPFSVDKKFTARQRKSFAEREEEEVDIEFEKDKQLFLKHEPHKPFEFLCVSFVDEHKMD
jgi:hypothetical protein